MAAPSSLVWEWDWLRGCSWDHATEFISRDWACGWKDLICQMKEKLLLLSRFLFSITWNSWLLLMIFLKNIVTVGQNWKVKNDSCNLSESFISSLNRLCRDLLISSNSCVFLSSHYAFCFSLIATYGNCCY